MLSPSELSVVCQCPGSNHFAIVSTAIKHVGDLYCSSQVAHLCGEAGVLVCLHSSIRSTMVEYPEQHTSWPHILICNETLNKRHVS